MGAPASSPTGGRIRAALKAGATRLGYYSRPTFLIIGTQKGGTVALRNYLARHPNVVPARKKEIGYFDQDMLYRRGRRGITVISHCPTGSDATASPSRRRRNTCTIPKRRNESSRMTLA